MKKILKSNRQSLIRHFLEYRGKMTQAEAGSLVGLNKQSVASFCSRYGIIGWPQGAASRDQRGHKNPAFINGLSRATINRTTKAVLTKAGRNLFTCERCGAEKDIELPRHHKDRNRTNNSVDNLEVLCVSCHNKEHMPERTRDSLGRLQCNTK